jgi:cytochrome b561
MLYGPTYLPQLMPHDAALYAVLRSAHIWLAYLFFATILTHVAAAPFHAWCAMTACCRP